MGDQAIGGGEVAARLPFLRIDIAHRITPSWVNAGIMPLWPDAAPYRCRPSRGVLHGDLSGTGRRSARPRQADGRHHALRDFRRPSLRLAGRGAALDWIAAELAAAGLAVTEQRFTMDRQYVFERGTLEVGGPADRHRAAMVDSRGPGEPRAQRADRARGVAAAQPALRPRRLSQRGPSRQACRGLRPKAGRRCCSTSAIRAARSSPTTSIRRPSSWPVPVLLVASRDVPHLRPGATATVSLRGAYRRGVKGRNIVARLDRGRGRWLVISTPVTSWFTSTCERGPGIAGFLAMARLAKEKFTEHDLVFVATSGHEIGHGGMEHFMRDGAPPPESTAAWAHFGSSLACRDPVVRRSTARSPWRGRSSGLRRHRGHAAHRR